VFPQNPLFDSISVVSFNSLFHTGGSQLMNIAATYAAEQQLFPVAAHRYPTLPAPVDPHVPSWVTVTPDRGAAHAVVVLE